MSGVREMVFLSNGGFDKPPSRLAAMAELDPKALAPYNKKAGLPRLSKAHLFRSTLDLVSPAMPKF